MRQRRLRRGLPLIALILTDLRKSKHTKHNELCNGKKAEEFEGVAPAPHFAR
jgi:hypothetical protein